MFSDGSNYEGEFHKDQIFGSGTYIDKNDNKHLVESGKGYFENCKINGFGRILFSNRDLYEGEFKDGDFSGYGVMRYRGMENPYYNQVYDHEGVYYGYWKMGRREGQGRMLW